MKAASAYAVNGRFLGQRVTGVQRYARNVLSAIGARAAERDELVSVLAPSSAEGEALPGTQLIRAGAFDGHFWEQFSLPRLSAGPLLNLCNTAPVVKRKQVVCIHDASVFNAPDSYSLPFRTVYRTLQPMIARRATRIATVSKYSAQEIARHLPVDLSEIEVLPNGHEHALDWRADCAEVAPRILEGRRSDRPFVLALGSKALHKNLQLVVGLASELDSLGIDVVIAGGDGGIFSSTAHGTQPNVEWTGYVTDDDLAYLLDRALCLVFPSWTEGFGLPLVEAMARECPVISSDRASMPEICGDAALMAPPDRPEAWLAQIRKLADSGDLRQELVGKGQLRLSNYSWRKTAEGYEDLMSGKPVGKSAESSTMHAPRIAVAIATIGRPDVVSATVRRMLDRQTLKPHDVIVSCVKAEDAGDLHALEGVRIIYGPKGLPAQRNTALNNISPDTDFVAFFDDDFVAADDWLAAAVEAFQSDAGIAAVTGLVLADDVKGPGFSFEEAIEIVDAEPVPESWTQIAPFSPYGCNMAFRMSAVGDHRFDERLVLYGWLEDRDFGAGLAKRGGRLVKIAGARGVHMGTKGGRIAGDRLGYSQIVNPLYMLKKGTMTVGQVTDHVFRNVASNILRTPFPEPFIDRWGRLKGNLRGVSDVIRGRLEPERAAEISAKKKQDAPSRSVDTT